MFNFFRDKSNQNDWKALLKRLESVVKAVDVEGWTTREEISKALNEAVKTIESSDIDKGVFFPEHESVSETAETVAYLRSWYMSGEAPSLVGMVAGACEHFEITKPDCVQSILMAAVLGEVENDLPYHNNLHFKKVMLQLIRLISVHNVIYKGTARSLDEDDVTLLLVGGAIHDLGHDGLGNTVKGVFYPGRLERQSFDFAKPYLQATGMSDEQLSDLKVAILTTDVAPLGNVTNSMHQMKAAYRYHFLGESEQHEMLNLSEDLKPLENNPKLSTMACLLHEADIATSAGLDYGVTQFETCIYSKEIGGEEAYPSQVLDFLNKVCQRKFLSDAGQKLFGANMARIYALAEEDERNGNEAYPKAVQTDFILGQVIKNETSKTLN
ncbi:MAG: hypothetical protein AAF204_01290 [Pseudomonadota bacterium]